MEQLAHPLSGAHPLSVGSQPRRQLVEGFNTAVLRAEYLTAFCLGQAYADHVAAVLVRTDTPECRMVFRKGLPAEVSKMLVYQEGQTMMTQSQWTFSLDEMQTAAMRLHVSL